MLCISHIILVMVTGMLKEVYTFFNLMFVFYKELVRILFIDGQTVKGIILLVFSKFFIFSALVFNSFFIYLL